MVRSRAFIAWQEDPAYWAQVEAAANAAVLENTQVGHDWRSGDWETPPLPQSEE